MSDAMNIVEAAWGLWVTVLLASVHVRLTKHEEKADE